MRKIAYVLTAVALLSGCAESNNTVDTSSNHMSSMPSVNASANTEDIMFTQMMIPHHSQAVEMSGFARTNTTNTEVLALAAKISAAQQPEIDLMSSWLHEWGIHDMPGMHSGDDGMLSKSQILALKAASGKEFDTLYLTGMLAHHQGAVVMAKDALAGGENPDVKTLARNIIKSQVAEIKQIQAILKELG